MEPQERVSAVRTATVIVCAAASFIANADADLRPSGPDCRCTIPGEIDGTPPVDFADFTILANHWLADRTPSSGNRKVPNIALYSDLLKQVAAHLPTTQSGRVSFMVSHSDPPWPFAYGNRHLSEPDAVPYLIDVMRNGPGWTDDELAPGWGETSRYLARCYAALCLGLSRYTRAFGPLLEVLLDTGIAPLKGTPYRSDDRHDLRSYAAFALGDLGDYRAIGPLHESLKNDHFVYCIYSLLKLKALSAIPSIIRIASEHDLNYFSTFSMLHGCFEYSMGVRFNMRLSSESNQWTVADYPRAGTTSVFESLGSFWLDWLTTGDEYAHNCFDTYYPEWDLAVRAHPENTSLQAFLLERMLAGGTATLPYIIAKISQGDNRLIPVLGQLTETDLNSGCTAEQCLEWWRENRQNWQVFDITSVTRILPVPERYPTIQAAIDDANDGDLVLVAPGTYTGTGNRDIDFRGKAITVKSENGPETCIVGCQGTEKEPHRGFDFHSGEGPNAILDGFTVTGGFVSGILQAGGAVRCQKGVTDRTYVSPTIINCIFRGNTAPGGGAISLDGSQAVIRNCIISDNVAIGLGGAIYCVYGSGPRIINCTVYGNHAMSGGGLYLGLGEGPSPALVRNCILWGNTSSAGSESFYQSSCGSTAGCVPLEIEHSCFFPVKLPPSDGLLPSSNVTEHNNLYVDPQFVDPNAGDFHLKSQAGRWNPVSQNWVKDDVTSPCIDAGDPSGPVSDEPFPDGGRINMGAYGGTAEASKSYFGKPLCQTLIAGDINGDCYVDFKDFALMAMNWPAGLSVKVSQPAEVNEPSQGDEPGEIPEPPLPPPVPLLPLIQSGE